MLVICSLDYQQISIITASVLFEHKQHYGPLLRLLLSYETDQLVSVTFPFKAKTQKPQAKGAALQARILRDPPAPRNTM